MSSVMLFLSGDAALLALAVLGATVARKSYAPALVYFCALAISAAMLIGAVVQLLGGMTGEGIVLPLGLPWIGAHFRVDALSALFLVIVNLGGAAACLYGLGEGRSERSPERVLPFFPAFLAGMNLVLVADDAYSFLLSWEFMSIASWALVMAHHREDDNARAGYVYIVMASFGTLTLLLAFALLAGPAGGYAFDAMRAASATPGVAGLAFLLALIGAGSKAGIVPLHVWLPLAHPAAPSHVSALMSGVMTKVAVYGFVRIVFELAGPGGLVVERSGSDGRRGHRLARRSLRSDAARPQALARVPHGREYWHYLYRTGARAGVRRVRHALGRGAGPDGRPLACVQSFPLQEPAVLRRGRGVVRDR